MKHYRSSKYRFPDDIIEQRVRQAAMKKLHGPGMDLDGQHSPIDPVSEEPILGEGDPYGAVGKRSSALGGHQATEPESERGRRAMKVLDNPKLSLEPAAGASRQDSDPYNKVGRNFMKPAPKRIR